MQCCQDIAIANFLSVHLIRISSLFHDWTPHCDVASGVVIAVLVTSSELELEILCAMQCNVVTLLHGNGR